MRIYQKEGSILNTMPREQDYNKSEEGNWNVASEYARIKIMTPLANADQYANIAIFGHAGLMDELNDLHTIPIEILQLKGLKRLIYCLIQLIDNSKFAVKNPKDKEILDKHKKRLKKILTIFPQLSKTITNQVKRTKSTRINEKNYELVLEDVLNIKAAINEPLNKNNLIFIDKATFDPKEYKKKIKARMMGEG